MPSAAKQMRQEVRAIIITAVESGRVVDPAWVCQYLVAQHADIAGPDVEWYRIHAYENLRQIIGRVVREFHLNPEDHLEPDPQMILPGFEHVQKAYAIQRDGRNMIIPIEQLSDEEILAKCDELRRMAKGCYQHADELERYLDERDAP